MAYDQELAGRIRQFIGSDPELTEKKLFGGLAFLMRGNMAIAASNEGGAMVRVDPAQSDARVATTRATPMNQQCGQVGYLPWKARATAAVRLETLSRW